MPEKFDHGKPPISLIPTLPLMEVAKVMGHGANKYGAYNWRGGLEYSRYLSAAMRHILAFQEGENTDPESHQHHLAHAICSLMFVIEWQATQTGEDDRYKK